MLIFALAATIVGFALLVVGLVTGTVWLALACIAVCVLGLVFLVADIVSAGRRGRSSHDGGRRPAAESLITRPEPTPAPEPGSLTQEEDRRALWQGVVTSRPEADPSVPESPRWPTAGTPAVADGPQGSPQAPEAAVAEPHPTPTAPPTERGYADYLRSVGVQDSGLSASAPPPASDIAPTRDTAAHRRAPNAEHEPTSPLDPARETGRPEAQKFDPLDPRWRPPSS